MSERDRRRRYYLKLRRECLEVLGNECACCGEQETVFLQIDHVNGGGRQHRSSLSGSMAKLKVAILANRSEYQILCANCHQAKSSGFSCPCRVGVLDYA